MKINEIGKCNLLHNAGNRIPPIYEKLSDQFVYWIIDVLLHQGQNGTLIFDIASFFKWRHPNL